MSDISLSLMTGNDIPIPELQLVLHVPTVKEIGKMGEQDFFTAAQYLCIQKESLTQDENILSVMTNFQVLMEALGQISKEKKNAIVMLLKLLFPDYNAMFNKNSIILSIVSEGRESVLIDEQNFDVFQSIIREALCLDTLFQGGNQPLKPVNSKAKKIAEKIKRGRQRVAAQKEDSGGILVRYISVLTVGISSMSIEDCLNLNLFQIFDLMERYSAKVEWDVDLQVRLAGGSPEEKVESWMKELHSKN